MPANLPGRAKDLAVPAPWSATLHRSTCRRIAPRSALSLTSWNTEKRCEIDSDEWPW